MSLDNNTKKRTESWDEKTESSERENKKGPRLETKILKAGTERQRFLAKRPRVEWKRLKTEKTV